MDEPPIQFRFTLAGLCLATLFAAVCGAMLMWPYYELTAARVAAAFAFGGAALGVLFGSLRIGVASGLSAYLVISILAEIIIRQAAR